VNAIDLVFRNHNPGVSQAGKYSLSGHSLLQKLVGQEASLFDAVHTFAYLMVHLTAYGYFP
jgi:hypothetical protein